MAHSINKVLIIGHLGKAPELRYTPSGKPVCHLSVATSGSYRDKTGEWVDETQWHRVTVLGSGAEWAGRNLGKGRSVYLEGQIRYGHYMHKVGVRIPTVEIVAFEIGPFGRSTAAGVSEGPAAGLESGGLKSEPGVMDDPSLAEWVRDYERA